VALRLSVKHCVLEWSRSACDAAILSPPRTEPQKGQWDLGHVPHCHPAGQQCVAQQKWGQHAAAPPPSPHRWMPKGGSSSRYAGRGCAVSASTRSHDRMNPQPEAKGGYESNGHCVGGWVVEVREGLWGAEQRRAQACTWLACPPSENLREQGPSSNPSLHTTASGWRPWADKADLALRHVRLVVRVSDGPRGAVACAVPNVPTVEAFAWPLF